MLERLRALHERGVESFFYHTDNQCYKSYVLKKTLDALKKSTENIVAPENLPAEVSTQGSSQPSSSMSTRSKASSERHPPCKYYSWFCVLLLGYCNLMKFVSLSISDLKELQNLKLYKSQVQLL